MAVWIEVSKRLCRKHMVKIMDNQTVTSSLARSDASNYVSRSVGGGVRSTSAQVVSPATAKNIIAQGGPVYISPKGTIDAESGFYILEYRNQDTGEVKVQFPSRKVVTAYRGVDSAPIQEASSEAPSQEVSTVTKPEAAPAPTRAVHQDTVA